MQQPEGVKPSMGKHTCALRQPVSCMPWLAVRSETQYAAPSLLHHCKAIHLLCIPKLRVGMQRCDAVPDTDGSDLWLCVQAMNPCCNSSWAEAELT